MLTSSYFGKKMLHNFFQSKKITIFFLLWFLFFSLLLLTSQFTHSCISTMILLFSVSDFSKNGSKNWNIAFGVSTFNGNIINCFFILFFQTELLYWPRPIVAFPWDQHDPSWLCNLFLWMHLSANITAAKSGLSYGHFTFRSTSHTHWSCKLCYVQTGSICWTNLLSFIQGN